MQQTKSTTHTPQLLLTVVALGWTLAMGSAFAQSPAEPPGSLLTLKALFERAWKLQPEAQSADLRRESAQAARNGASSWTAEPAALQLTTKTDRPGSNQGSREIELGVALPLWLPGERARKAALGDAEIKAMESRRLAAQLQLAATVREAWWTLQRTQTELGLAQDRLQSALQLAADVARRVRAGDMSRADQTQANGAAAQAEAAVAEATGARDAAQAALTVWGGPVAQADDGEPEALPPVGPPADHPTIADWQNQADVARRTANLAAVQTRANSELTVAATRGREQSGERYLQSFTVGVRVPLGSGDRARAKEAAARADALDAETRARNEQNRLAADVAAAAARVRAAQAQHRAMTRHAALARDTRGFIDKAFLLGEADWPTRLRVELEAVQAERQLARARIDAAAAISTLRQAMGLLPQ